MALLRKDFLPVNTCCHPEIIFHISMYHVQTYFSPKIYIYNNNNNNVSTHMTLQFGIQPFQSVKFLKT